MSLPVGLRRTLTWDQGKELALHQQITARTGTQVYFCDAHAPWQRGSNENVNGLLRDYFPKSTDLSVHTADSIRGVAIELNHRPRKTLDWNRPADPSPTHASPPETNAPGRRPLRHDSTRTLAPYRETELSAITEPASPLRGSGHPRN